MNMNDMAKSLAEQNGMTQAEARRTVDGFFAVMTNALKGGDEVKISGFGNFKVIERPERTGRNPATGEAITVAASKKVTFKAAKALKDTLG